MSFLRNFVWIYKPLLSPRSYLHEETVSLLNEKTRELFHLRLEKLALESNISRLERQLRFIEKEIGDTASTVPGGNLGASEPPGNRPPCDPYPG